MAKFILQVKTPIIDGAGVGKTQIAANFEANDEHVWVETFFGTLIFSRAEVIFCVFLPEDFDLQLLVDVPHIMVL